MKRRLLAEVGRRLRDTPAIVLLGPRQVGKTTLARDVVRAQAGRGGRAVYLDLERPSDLRRLDDAAAYLRAQTGHLTVLDEVHRVPRLFEMLRGVIDDRRAGGERGAQFMLLGSASPELIRQASESLAGRVAYLELGPIGVPELPRRGISVDRLWARGGFPLSLLAGSDAASFRWRQDFVRSYLERDVPMFAPRLPAETVGRLWGMLAHAQGTLLNQARLASSLGVSSPAVARYLDLLVDLFLVRRLRPWSGNVGKRLTRSPKTYLRDSGVLHALLGLARLDDVLGHPIAGPSWEGFVVENLIAAAGPDRIPLFYRTERGAEVDLLFERGGRVELAIEIKRTSAPTVPKGFRIACDDLAPGAAYVVHGGRDRWPMGGGVTALSVAELAGKLRGT